MISNVEEHKLNIMADSEEKLVLKAEVIKKYLQNFDFTTDRESMQFLHLVLASKRIEALNNSILEAKHVQFLDLQNNNVVDIALLAQFPNLVKLNVSKNKIKSIAVFSSEEAFLNLKWLDVSNNKFTELALVKCPKLEYVDLSYNKLEKVSESWVGHPTVRVLKSVDNKFKSLQIFKDMPKLEELYLEANVLTSILGYETMPKLRVLHIRKNRLEKFEEELPPHEGLAIINMRGNKLQTLDQVERLYATFPNLSDINILGNPVEKQMPSFNLLIAEVLIKNPKIKRFSKVEITDQHKLEAVFLAKYRWTKMEEERKKKEEEERKKAEAEGAAAE